MRIEFQGKSEKDLKRLPVKQQKQVVAKITALSHDPKPRGSRPLKGKLASCYRVKAGEYRIVYRIEGDTLCIARIGKRNDGEAYR